MYHVLNFLEIAKKGRAKGIFFALQKRVDLDKGTSNNDVRFLGGWGGHAKLDRIGQGG